MLELIFIAAAFLYLRYQLAYLENSSGNSSLAPTRTNARLAQMVAYADRLYQEKKWLAAEKAYLSVLKSDHKNVTAYGHLGIIYSTQKNMADAIECFEIAARLNPGGSTLQNLALAYYDNKNYMKSVAAFEKAIMFEPTAQRYVGLSKSWRKLSNISHAVTALEKAASLDPSKRVLEILEGAKDEAINDPAVAPKPAQTKSSPPAEPSPQEAPRPRAMR
ncbi:MAG TPA: tetratricopeptide repeat protein [Candidatus Saccharimonadia bacterium]|nr:tetratricopeptide repeat protein [Candidatus Saccharimonadia bacterium]